MFGRQDLFTSRFLEVLFKLHLWMPYQISTSHPWCIKATPGGDHGPVQRTSGLGWWELYLNIFRISSFSRSRSQNLVDFILLGKELPGCKGLALAYIRLMTWEFQISGSWNDTRLSDYCSADLCQSCTVIVCLESHSLHSRKFDMKLYAVCFHFLLYYLAPTMITTCSFQVVQYRSLDRQDLASRRSFEKKLESDFDKSLEMAAWAVSVTSGRTGIGIGWFLSTHPNEVEPFEHVQKYRWKEVTASKSLSQKSIFGSVGWERDIWSMKEE